MACSCKGGASSKQVTAVQQVVKKTPNNTVMASSKPQRKPLIKRVILKRPM